MVKEYLKCYHCGQPCEVDDFTKEDKKFCCYGCKVVYEIIHENDLCQYYDYEDHPGLSSISDSEHIYDYLDDVKVSEALLDFRSNDYARISFFIPAVHCVSCIWLLENLDKLDRGIFHSEVNFGKKTVSIDFNPGQVLLSRVAALLASVGYPPHIQHRQENAQAPAASKSLLIKMAVAGFCFGNVMMFSFPEYLGMDKSEPVLQNLFGSLNVVLSIPVLVFSGRDYFVSSWKSLQLKELSIDVPIAVGLIALFARSLWEILTGYGPGYFDSFTGLVFFLLIGKWFQSKTYENLAFDRDFKSYFPLAVQKWNLSGWKPVLISELHVGERIRVRNQEIIPADCILVEDESFIDYSFVTGESKPTRAGFGSLIYAGGRLLGHPAVLTVHKLTSQSYLTSIWNHESFRKPGERNYHRLIDRSAKVFTWVVLVIAGATGIFWFFKEPAQMWLVLTSVLIVACPCALALATPFTYGSMLRAFGKNGFYLKSTDVIERLACIDAIVFDKTGTITHGMNPEVTYFGDCTSEELATIKLLASFSTHPMSGLISGALSGDSKELLTQFRELPGKGIEGYAGSSKYQLGSSDFTGVPPVAADGQSFVYVSIDNRNCGYFSIQGKSRPGIRNMISQLGDKSVALLSGDGPGERTMMKQLFGDGTGMHFDQGPHDKRNYIQQLQDRGKKVMMVGDGLNDAGALKQSDVGISVSDNTGLFVPSCDGILQGDKLASLHGFFRLAKKSKHILYGSFAISLIYNAITMTFAVSGQLTPLIAAVLMPVSSISVVLFSSLAVWMAESRQAL